MLFDESIITVNDDKPVVLEDNNSPGKVYTHLCESCEFKSKQARILLPCR